MACGSAATFANGGLYLGWFDSKKRGNPLENILGVGIEGATSSSPKFEARAASSDRKAAHRLVKTTLRIAPDGKSHTWKIEYQPDAHGGRGRLTVWLDDHQDSFTLPPELRKTGATFDRFGLFVHEGGGRASRISLHDLTYTAAPTK